MPAYDHILKLSHIFNLLDARGAVGFTERQDNFGRMRSLARQVSSLYQERRAELGHPLGVVATLPVRPHARPACSSAGPSGLESCGGPCLPEAMSRTFGAV